jgi:hypothetical protein
MRSRIRELVKQGIDRLSRLFDSVFAAPSEPAASSVFPDLKGAVAVFSSIATGLRVSWVSQGAYLEICVLRPSVSPLVNGLTILLRSSDLLSFYGGDEVYYPDQEHAVQATQFSRSSGWLTTKSLLRSSHPFQQRVFLSVELNLELERLMAEFAKRAPSRAKL